MSLTQKQRNNLILFSSAFLIVLLNMLNHMVQGNEKYIPVFEADYQPTRIELSGLIWKKQEDIWVCSFTHIECAEYGEFFESLTIAQVEAPNGNEALEGFEIRFSLNHSQQTLVWFWYPEKGLIESHTSHWYKLPASAQQTLEFLHQHPPP
jgi:hypothetical protein